jgi:hypothetical protein
MNRFQAWRQAGTTALFDVWYTARQTTLAGGIHSLESIPQIQAQSLVFKGHYFEKSIKPKNVIQDIAHQRWSIIQRYGAKF